MGNRSELQTLLIDLLDSNNVYFQPPESLKMIYPCITYSLDNIKTIHADNSPYRKTNRYQLIYIDRNPDNNVVGKLSDLPQCEFSRTYTSDGLNHYVFNIFF